MYGSSSGFLLLIALFLFFNAIGKRDTVNEICQMADLFENAYQWQRNLFTDVVADFVSGFIQGKDHLNPQFSRAVNA